MDINSKTKLNLKTPPERGVFDIFEKILTRYDDFCRQYGKIKLIIHEQEGMTVVYIAHVREYDKAIQSVRDHLIGVCHLAERYGEKLGLRSVAGLAGLLHDLGKYSDSFQSYIQTAAFHPEDSNYRRGEVDHSTAGGKLLFSLLHHEETSFHEKLLAEIVSNAIISHHSNLQDYISPNMESDFLRRVRDKQLPEYEQAVERFFEDTISREELSDYISAAVDELRQYTAYSPEQCFFLSKFIFSCLIDADRTDTRRFEEQREAEGKDEEGSSHEYTQQTFLFERYYHRLLDHLAALKDNNQAKGTINELRAQMSEACDTFASKPSGIYTLSIPTGGGKTLASLRYALKHALEFKKHRIIYVVPYTTIIEQNAQEVRQILADDEHILEHHSNIIEDSTLHIEQGDEADDGLITQRERLKLARDNWDSPIIFTTLVQFLNVFYAKGNRNTRRLHNLSHSVIIFDEVQKVPVHCISLFNEALNFLKQTAHCSILLCTATQPTLERVKHSLLKDRDGEIVSDLESVSKAFKRVELVDRIDKPMTNEQLAAWIQTEIEEWGSTLVILNTKKVVKDLYLLLKETSIPVYHLSTSMCASHRKDQLKEIREMLNRKIPFVCVTTQLIEAGVDVSFRCVIRSLAGLDSIAQAAGRCNRHGEELSRNVYIIRHAEEKLKSLKEIEIGGSISASLIGIFNKKAERYGGSLLFQRAMEDYFTHFYRKMESSLNYYVPEVNNEMTKLLMSHPKENSYINHYYRKTGKPFPLCLCGSYRTAAEHFQVIDEPTTSVIVPYHRGREIIAQLNSIEWIEDLNQLLKEAQHYIVNLYPQEWRILRQEGAIVEHLDGMIYELRENWYSKEYGGDFMGEGELEFISW